MFISNSQVFLLLLKLRGAVRRRQGEKKVLGLQQLSGMGTQLLGPWQVLAPTHHPRKYRSWTTSAKTRAKGLEGVRRLRCRCGGWQAAHSPRSWLCGWGHPSVFSWATSHQPFPPLQSCHMLLSVQPQKKEKNSLLVEKITARGGDDHCGKVSGPDRFSNLYLSTYSIPQFMS